MNNKYYDFITKDKNKIIYLAPIVSLLIAIPPMPYVYYQLLRWLICGCSAYIAFQSYEQNNFSKTTIVFAFLAILYNPINPIYLFKEAWIIINILTIIAFMASVHNIINKAENQNEKLNK